MELNGKYVGKEYIIKKIYDLYKFKIDENLVHELVWDFMSLLAIPNSYIDATKVIDIKGQKGSLPIDFYQLMNGGVREYYSKIPMRVSTNIFYKEDGNEARHETVTTSDVIGVTTETGGETENTVLINPAEGVASELEYTYKINNYYIFVNFDEGKVEIAYKSFPIDEKGFPLVPDDAFFIQAMVDFITERYAFGLMLSERLSENKYNYIAKESYFSRGQVQGYAKMPSKDMMENMRQRSSMLLKNGEAHLSSFKYSNS